jgi:hypothetical protein
MKEFSEKVADGFLLHRSGKMTHLCSDKLSRWFTPETLDS